MDISQLSQFVLILLLLVILILLLFIFLKVKKISKSTPDWSMVYPELNAMDYENDRPVANRIFRSPVESLDTMHGNSIEDQVERKFKTDLSNFEESQKHVLCTAYAPKEVEVDEEFIVAAFVSFSKDKEKVDEAAQLLDDVLIKKAEKFLNLKIEFGDKLLFNLQANGCEIDDPAQEINWNGQLNSVEFGVNVLSGFKSKKLIAKLTIAKNGIPAGNIKFKIKVANENTVFETSDAPMLTTQFKNAFISYASADRNEVLRRTQMLSASGISFFQDVMNLKPGELWENSLYKEIDNCDVFYLFWSSSAKNSKWVKAEYEYAQNLQASGKKIEIIPVPIEGPPAPLPPDELAHLHFNDGFLYFLKG